MKIEKIKQKIDYYKNLLECTEKLESIKMVGKYFTSTDSVAKIKEIKNGVIKADVWSSEEKRYQKDEPHVMCEKDVVFDNKNDKWSEIDLVTYKQSIRYLLDDLISKEEPEDESEISEVQRLLSE